MAVGLLIAAGYAALVYEFGWLGLSVALIHVLVMLAAAWRRRD